MNISGSEVPSGHYSVTHLSSKIRLPMRFIVWGYLTKKCRWRHSSDDQLHLPEYIYVVGAEPHLVRTPFFGLIVENILQ